jgi:hypothetical protein
VEVTYRELTDGRLRDLVYRGQEKASAVIHSA